MLLLQAIDRMLGIVSMVVLARVLIPADFGLVAMAMSVVALVELLGAFNFDMALIQNQQAKRAQFDSAWTLNVLLGCGCGILLLAVAVPATLFYNEPRLVWLISALALAPAIGAFSNIGTVAFRKELDFRREFFYMMTKRLVSFVATITLALLLRNYWALVIGTLLGRGIGTLISYLLHPYRPRFALSKAKEILGFSGWLVANNIIYFILHKSADFAIGRTLGAGALGLHTVSYEIANMPTSHMVAPLNRAVYPAYAKVATEKDGLANAYLRVLGIIAMFALPAGIGIAAISNTLVDVLLGSRWKDAAPLISILAISGSIGALQTNVGYLYTALGKPNRQALLAGAYVLLLLPMLLVGITMMQLKGVALAFLAVASLHAPLTFILVARDLAISWKRYLAALHRPVLASTAMYIAVARIAAWDDSSPIWTGILLLVSSVGAGAVVYTATLLGLWLLCARPLGAEREVLNLARSLLISTLSRKAR